MQINSRVKGINVQGMKKLSLDLFEYSEQFKKIKSGLDAIENKLRTDFKGEAANSFNNSFKNFNNNLNYVSESIKNYSEYCTNIIRQYEKNDSLR